MAAPDIRPEDLGIKATILVIAINRVREAIRSFVQAKEVDTTTPEYEDFAERVGQVLKLTLNAFNQLAIEPLPFVVTNQKLQTEWRELKDRNKPDKS